MVLQIFAGAEETIQTVFHRGRSLFSPDSSPKTEAHLESIRAHLRTEGRSLLVVRFKSMRCGLQIVGASSPPFRTLTETEDRAICEMINAATPDILWVALGTPKQDIWMYEHREKLNVSVMHGVGAAFDFLSGEIRQAPRWMMHSGFEWLYRLMIEPRRLWKRYTINNALFLYYLLLEFLGLGRYRRPKRSAARPPSPP